jgi:uncharacterized membrane protein YphA (DoxX/SURF4 family)
MATPAAISEASPSTRFLPRALLLVGRLALGLIFVYAAFAKLHFNGDWHFGDYHILFAMAIDSYKILPMQAVQTMARFLPWFELVLGAWLTSGVGLRWAASISSALLLVFIGAMARAQILGLEINCGCFGNNEKLGTATLIRDSSLLVLSLAVMIGAFLVKKRRVTISS